MSRTHLQEVNCEWYKHPWPTHHHAPARPKELRAKGMLAMPIGSTKQIAIYSLHGGRRNMKDSVYGSNLISPNCTVPAQIYQFEAATCLQWAENAGPKVTGIGFLYTCNHN